MSAETVLTKNFLKSASNGPGVYLMLSEKEVLYVGKAGNLRKRLATYARFPESKHSKTSVMLSKVLKVDTILTATEKEALILEASLIKKHRPRYNVILRDDKNYPLIKITIKDQWPRIMVTRKRLRDGNRFFGPFSSPSAMRSTLKLLFSMLPLRRCKRVRQRKRACLNYQLKRCLGPCIDKVSHEQYQTMVHQALLILEGKDKELIPQLEKMMALCSQELKFEKAAKYRDFIDGIKRTVEKQVIVSEHFRNQDIFGLSRKNTSIAIAILFVRSGKISGSQTYFLDDPIGEDDRILTETILQYYSTQRPPPEEIILATNPEDIQLLHERLLDISKNKLSIIVPKRGKNKQLITMANSNATQVFSDLDRKKQSWDNLSKTLQKKLCLQKPPHRIECLDISNIGGKQAVGSLICFTEGVKEKKHYRHYKIRSKDTPDDYAMMKETLQRHFKNTTLQCDTPELFIVDGGKGQLNIAKKIIEKSGLTNKIDLVAIAKGKQNQEEKLFRPGRKNAIILKKNDPVLLFIMRIRDESHRFGITFHKKLRKKKIFLSALDNIKGIGEKRKKDLLRSLGSLKRIQEASPNELAQIPGIGHLLAEDIYRQLHPENNTPNTKT